MQSQFTYDILNVETGRITERTVDSNNNEVLKEYNKAGRLYKVTAGNDVTTYEYNADGSTNKVIYSNGATEEYEYNVDKTLKKLINTNGETVQQYSYEYDNNNNIVKKTDAKGVTTYTYDYLNRLLIVQAPTETTVYEYDSTGNRTKEMVGDTVKEYTYNAKNEVTSIIEKENNVQTKETTYTYDNNGNQLEVREDGVLVQSNVFNERNELTQTTKGQTVASYEYNVEGKRISKQVGEEVTKFVYEGDKVILEVDENNNEKAVNVYGLALISRDTGTDKGYYLYNGHGDVESIIDNTGVELNNYYYDAFGNLEEQTGTFNNPYTYAGYYYDSETQNYYLMSRYYNPELARFITEYTYRGELDDPLSLNRYVYVKNNPLIYNDPDGYAPKVLEWLWEGTKYIGTRAVGLVHAAAETVVDIGVGAVNFGYELGESAKAGTLGQTLYNLPGNMVQGIKTNFQTTFNWDNFKGYLDPNASYDYIKDYSKSALQTAGTLYGGYKIVSGVAHKIYNLTHQPPTINAPQTITINSPISETRTITGAKSSGSYSKPTTKIDISTSKINQVSDVANNYKLNLNQYQNHIVSRHGSSSIYPNKSKFNANFNIKTGIDTTLKSPNSLIRPNTAGRTGYIFEHTYSKAIGVSSNNALLNTMKVVLDEAGNVITAFPKK